MNLIAQIRVLPAIVAIVLACTPAARAGEPAAAERTLQGLGWLAGCWAAEGGETGSVEQWTEPAAGTMLGMSRTVSAGRTRMFEFMRIHVLEDGRLAFTAHPSGQSPGTFPLLRADATEVVFENLEHDFPQRVIYRLEAPGRLAARIEGLNEGKPLMVPFPMRRVACPGPAASQDGVAARP